MDSWSDLHNELARIEHDLDSTTPADPPGLTLAKVLRLYEALAKFQALLLASWKGLGELPEHDDRVVS